MRDAGLAQAKADAARQAAEQQAAENAQLVAHLSLLEGEREAAQARTASAHFVCQAQSDLHRASRNQQGT